MVWYIFIAILLLWLSFNLKHEDNKETFISGTEKMMVNYDQIYPLDDPNYINPQQKDFQVVLSEHSALDPNFQDRRQDIRTQKCRGGSHCFDSREWHALNYKNKSAPDVINTKIPPEDIGPRSILYTRHNADKVVPFNSTSREMRADLFTEIMIPDLFFAQRRVINKGEPKPEDRTYATEIY